jgi:hypothetical protein
MKKGYEQTYEWVLKLLQDYDLAEAAKQLDIKQISKNHLAIDFLGRTYLISNDTIELTGQAIEWSIKREGFEYNIKSVLGYYVLAESSPEPLNDYCQSA